MGAVIQLTTTTKPSRPMPAWTWEELEQELTRIAPTPEQRALVAPLVAALSKRSVFTPAPMVLRELLCLASVIADETWRDGSSDEPIETI
jgi:hypothetical protein